MKILFLTLVDIHTIEDRNIYTELMKTFAEKGHDIYLVSPTEKRNGKNSYVIQEKSIHILKVKTGNLFNVSMIEKGISQIRLEGQYYKTIRHFFPKITFDFILYSTPPVSFVKTVEKIKRKDKARTYLLLKDIFPQNAVDLGMLKPWMAKLFFRRKENKLYKISDYIGCMSQANVDYILKHNRKIKEEKVEICPNSIRIPVENYKDELEKDEIRHKYGIPINTTVFLYGGNLGKPQDIPFIIQCLKKAESMDQVFFVICGNGTEINTLRNYIKEEMPVNMILIPGLPKQEYDQLVSVCDVGLLFLDSRFTIPNFPSRLLSYMEKSMPVLACTDECTDVGDIIEKGGFGKGCISDNPDNFIDIISCFMNHKTRKKMGEAAKKYLEEHYTTEKCYNIIMSHFIFENTK